MFGIKSTKVNTADVIGARGMEREMPWIGGQGTSCAKLYYSGIFFLCFIHASGYPFIHWVMALTNNSFCNNN